MQTTEIEQLITRALPQSQVYVEGDGTHFSALIICPIFAGQSRIARQQTVYASVKTQLLDGSLHALSLKTYTPDEWAALNVDGEN